MKIYRQHPVLVNRSSGVEVRAWPVRYATMFHMTNDSALFLTEVALKKQGFKPTALNRWKKGELEALPLYEGKMVQMGDHRAADVVVNKENFFAIDMSYLDKKGKVLPPFVFDSEDRAHRMARLDALFFELYRLNEKDVKYVLSTLPIVREKDEKQFGSFRTQDLILGYFKRLRGGQLLHDAL